MRMNIMDHGIWQTPGLAWTSEQKLLNFYLFNNVPLAPPAPDASDKANTMHLLHVRRTLDQYYYYTLEQTQERDGDQVVSRAPCQQDRHPESKVLTMVDQLWLWVLAGQGDQPDTVISCFPERTRVEYPPPSPDRAPGSFKLPYDPDVKYGTTDVLGHIKVHLLDNPSSVRSCHDLAKLIASKCSGAYFNMGSSDERLRFPEIYEMAIGNVVRKETRLFDEFTAVMKAQRSETSNRKDVMKLLKAVETLEEDISKTTEPGPELTNKLNVLKEWKTDNDEMARKLCKVFYETALRQEVGKNDLQTLLDPKSTPEQRIDIVDALRWIAQIQVLDITAETQLLRDIKDVRDELRIMSMVFQDQKVVIDAMEAISITNAAAVDQGPDEHTDNGLMLERGAKTRGQDGDNTGQAIPVITDRDATRQVLLGTEGGPSARQQDSHDEPPDATDATTELGDQTNDAPNIPESMPTTFNVGRNLHVNGAESFFASLADPITFNVARNVYIKSPSPSGTMTAITLTESSNISPRATVQLSIDAIDRMAERATNAYKAVSNIPPTLGANSWITNHDDSSAS